MNEKKELSMSERISWALGQATGRQFITALVSTYILIFMTDVFGVPAAGSRCHYDSRNCLGCYQ